MKKPWFLAGGAIPACSYYNGLYYNFDGGSQIKTKSEMLVDICEELNAEQIATLCNVVSGGKLIKGIYSTWSDFCAAHGLDTPAE